MIQSLRFYNKRVAAEAVTLCRDGFEVIKKGDESECSYLTLRHRRNHHVIALIFDNDKAVLYKDGKFLKQI